MARNAGRYRREAQAALADLREAELLVARDFLEYLRTKRLDRATLEILRSPALMRDTRASLADLRRGQLSRFRAWNDVKQHHV